MKIAYEEYQIKLHQWKKSNRPPQSFGVEDGDNDLANDDEA